VGIIKNLLEKDILIKEIIIEAGVEIQKDQMIIALKGIIICIT